MATGLVGCTCEHPASEHGLGGCRVKDCPCRAARHGSQMFLSRLILRGLLLVSVLWLLSRALYFFAISHGLWSP
jgi:hypothetical protein